MNKIAGITVLLTIALFVGACGGSGDPSMGRDNTQNTASASTDTSRGSLTTNTTTLPGEAVDLTQEIVGKTYYLGDPHVESYIFSTDGTVKDTWIEDGQEVSEVGVYSIEGDVLLITFASTEGTARLTNARRVDNSLRFYNDNAEEVAVFYTEMSTDNQEEIDGYSIENTIAFTPELLKNRVVYFVFEDSTTDPRKYASVKFLQSNDLNGSHRGTVVSTPYDANGSQIGTNGSRTVDPYIILEDGSLEIDTFDIFKLLAKEPTRWVVYNKHTSYTYRDGNRTTERVVEWLLEKPEAIYNHENNISN